MTLYWLLIGGLALANLACLPYFLFLLSISLAALFSRRRHRAPSSPTSRFLIVVPAHDEESVIATTVRSCLSVNYAPSKFSVLVIADNCTDHTASVAKEAAARVVERFDAQKRSKGYAIEFLIDRLKQSGELESLDALVIIDADTIVDPELLQSFAAGLENGADWIQAYYTVANPDESWRTRLLKYAFSMYNGVMLLGQQALGGSASFKGNGMCFSVRGLRRVPFTCYGLVEDMEYSWTLKIAGEKIAFQPDVSVYGTMLKAGGKAAVEQRRRWEFGRRGLRRKFVAPVLRSEKLGVCEKIVSICELTIPSLAVLGVIGVVLATCNLAALYAGAFRSSPIVDGFLLASSLVMIVALGVYALSPFFAMRLPVGYLWAVLSSPLYLAWKLMVFSKGAPKQWVRTAREKPKSDVDAECESEVPTTR
jgi:cellulose synthase/poly-beta-1,6-N-acetylglucosamine synthase-like glycosyltransferase